MSVSDKIHKGRRVSVRTKDLSTVPTRRNCESGGKSCLPMYRPMTVCESRERLLKESVSVLGKGSPVGHRFLTTYVFLCPVRVTGFGPFTTLQ